MKRHALTFGLGLALALGSAGTASAQDINISPDGPNGIVVSPAVRYAPDRMSNISFTDPGYGSPSQGLNAGGPLDNNIGAGHATYSSGDFQGDISEGLSNEGWRFDLEGDEANGGSQPNEPST
ncbi:MAG: hypothetical protein AB7P40_30900 [Chloroflexota bacterium]